MICIMCSGRRLMLLDFVASFMSACFAMLAKCHTVCVSSD